MLFSKRETVLQREHKAVPAEERSSTAALVILSCLFPLFFFYLDTVVVSWVKYLHQARPPVYSFLEVADPLINFLGHGATLIIGSLILYAVGRQRDRNLERLGKTLFIGLLSAGVVVQGLKHLSGRARPRLTDDLLFIGPSFRSGYDSFPSGHTTLAFCMATILSQYFPSYRTAFYAFAVIVGLARVEGAAHFPSDVLAGAIVGILVGRIFSGRMTSSARSVLCQR
ncbi:MAG TPA: phosphatase PAP2 family protein [Thermodesulfovibrionales bacterium]|nr:phosphatase PAP2 family protein [Thermodesulfovibrionales bacterium]